MSSVPPHQAVLTAGLQSKPQVCSPGKNPDQVPSLSLRDWEEVGHYSFHQTCATAVMFGCGVPTIQAYMRV